MEYICWKDLPHNKKKKAIRKGIKKQIRKRTKTVQQEQTQHAITKVNKSRYPKQAEKSPRKSFHTSSFHSRLILLHTQGDPQRVCPVHYMGEISCQPFGRGVMRSQTLIGSWAAQKLS
ncbi:hypothetical protein CDAR_398871 [Caerostris darwini]|uniref:Ribosomal protein S12 n=1 Tax=Caerostris darwini TaxID=1538125 RepID=A0AAV4V8M5_9ARAC|nr:hypothetical protein CDAR_398871 [Caerostris darwini]